MLMGLVGTGLAGPPPATPSFTFVASGTGATPTITIPGTPAAGDLCIIWNVSQNTANTPTDVTPSGFTNIAGTSGGGSFTRARMTAKILAGGETTVTGMDGETRERWIAATFHPSIPITSFIPGGELGSPTTGDPTSLNIAASGITPPVLLLGSMFGGGTTPTYTISPAMTELTALGTNVHYKIYNPGDTPVNHTYDMDDVGANNNALVVYLTFT